MLALADEGVFDSCLIVTPHQLALANARFGILFVLHVDSGLNEAVCEVQVEALSLADAISAMQIR